MSKEWLEDIKERFAKYQTDYNLNGEDVEWLIQQAERVQELESELNKQIEIGYKFEGEAYDLEKENKRYREALNTILTLWIASTDATDDTWLAHEMSETARKALEGEKNGMEYTEVRESVKWFAKQMETKLRENDKKGGWDNCDIYWLIKRINEETNELLNAVDLHRDSGATKENIIRESVDVANFAMMIADITRKYLKD